MQTIMEKRHELAQLHLWKKNAVEMVDDFSKRIKAKEDEIQMLAKSPTKREDKLK